MFKPGVSWVYNHGSMTFMKRHCPQVFPFRNSKISYYTNCLKNNAHIMKEDLSQSLLLTSRKSGTQSLGKLLAHTLRSVIRIRCCKAPVFFNFVAFVRIPHTNKLIDIFLPVRILVYTMKYVQINTLKPIGLF